MVFPNASLIPSYRRLSVPVIIGANNTSPTVSEASKGFSKGCSKLQGVLGRRYDVTVPWTSFINRRSGVVPSAAARPRFKQLLHLTHGLHDRSSQDHHVLGSRAAAVLWYCPQHKPRLRECRLRCPRKSAATTAAAAAAADSAAGGATVVVAQFLALPSTRSPQPYHCRRRRFCRESRRGRRVPAERSRPGYIVSGAVPRPAPQRR